LSALMLKTERAIFSVSYLIKYELLSSTLF
jgi:hypothetical protein